jgi:hypothetical protein
MTLDEFAAKEGTTVSGLLEPVFAELADESARRDAEIRRDPMAFFESFCLDGLDDVPPFVAAVECRDVTVSYGLRRSNEEAEIYMIDARGGEWLVLLGRSTYSGSYWEPPEYDEEIDWKEA